MNLVEVTGPSIRLTCCACGHRNDSRPSPGYSVPWGLTSTFFADTEGKPWVDYYCGECATKCLN